MTEYWVTKGSKDNTNVWSESRFINKNCWYSMWIFLVGINSYTILELSFGVLNQKHEDHWEVVFTKAAALSSRLVWINKGRKHEAPNQTSANAEQRSLNFFFAKLRFWGEGKKKVSCAISDNCFCCERVVSWDLIWFPFTVKICLIQFLCVFQIFWILIGIIMQKRSELRDHQALLGINWSVNEWIGHLKQPRKLKTRSQCRYFECSNVKK